MRGEARERAVACGASHTRAPRLTLTRACRRGVWTGHPAGALLASLSLRQQLAPGGKAADVREATMATMPTPKLKLEKKKKKRGGGSKWHACSKIIAKVPYFAT